MNLALYKVLVTGATGFLGRALCRELSLNQKVSLIQSVRKFDIFNEGGEFRAVGNIDGQTDWSLLKEGVRVVIHTAAKVPSNKREIGNPLDEYREVNVEGTLNLARQAARYGVERFIFISSIKVNGEQTRIGTPYTADEVPHPEDSYGISKWEAEQGLKLIAEDTGMEIVIIRPTLVYGPGARGNFASLAEWVRKGIPLPLGSIDNKRSLVGLDNLVNLIITCVDHPAAGNQVFLASDGKDLSTTELLGTIAKAAGRSARLISVPSRVLWIAGILLGKKAMVQRLLGSLQVDITKNFEILGWTPPVSVEEGFKRCFTSDQDE